MNQEQLIKKMRALSGDTPIKDIMALVDAYDWSANPVTIVPALLCEHLVVRSLDGSLEATVALQSMWSRNIPLMRDQIALAYIVKLKFRQFRQP